LKNEIYESAMTNAYGAGSCRSGKAPKEMRFAGEEFCRTVVNQLVDNDEDVKEIMETVEANNKEEKEMKKNTKETKNTVTVALKAFTGMVIGEYEAKKTAKGYSISLKNGKTMNFNNSFKQVGSKGNRFANTIEVL